MTDHAATDPIAEPYARTLMALAGSPARAEELAGQFRDFVTAVTAQAQVREFLTAARTPLAAKLQVIERATAGKVDPLMVNFLKVIATHGRLGFVADMAVLLVRLLDDALGRVRAQVTTAAPLDDAQRQAIVAAILASTGRTPLLTETVRESLLGGFVLRVGDVIIDASTAQRLRLIGQALARRAVSDIQARAEHLAPMTVS